MHAISDTFRLDCERRGLVIIKFAVKQCLFNNYPFLASRVTANIVFLRYSTYFYFLTVFVIQVHSKYYIYVQIEPVTGWKV